MSDSTATKPATLLVLLFVLSAVLLMSAWVADDAFISFRVADNFWSGHGLRWNPDERVQVYTHPLWLLLLLVVRFISSNLYIGTLLLSALLTAWLVFLLCKHAASRQRLLAGILLLLASRAFIDYSSSGLENPLMHLLVVGLAIAMLCGPPRLLVISLLAALLILTRIDAALLVLPALIGLWLAQVQSRGLFPASRQVILGLLPLLLWLIFSLIYYGSPIPNTAWAKLNHGIDRAVLAERGIAYLVESFQFDPITLLSLMVIMIGTLFGSARSRLLATGLMLQLIYLVSIGADYMYGRFLSSSFVLAVTILVCDPSLRNISVKIIAALLVIPTLYGLWQIPAHTQATHYSTSFSKSGLADERGFYFPFTGLMSFREAIQPRHFWLDRGMELRAQGSGVHPACAVGMLAYRAGPQWHIVDPLALTDPYLAQSPAVKGPWRAGHHERLVGPDYLESLRERRNVMRDTQEARLLDDIWLIARAPLFSVERWQAIWRLNTGELRNMASSSLHTKLRKKPVPLRLCPTSGMQISPETWLLNPPSQTKDPQ